MESDGFRERASLNTFIRIPEQRIEKTHAIGCISKPGQCLGNYPVIIG